MLTAATEGLQQEFPIAAFSGSEISWNIKLYFKNKLCILKTSHFLFA